MSTTTAPSFPAPQPTRAQLRKSTRKLESVLGATPLVLELDPSQTTSSPSFMDTTPKASSGRAPITPRTRARRRRGQVFGGSSSSESSSSASDSRSSLESSLESTDASSAEEEDEKVVLDSTASDASYVFISSTTPKAGYVPRLPPRTMGGIPVETFRPLPHSNSYLMHDPNPKVRARSNTKSASKGMKDGETKKDLAGEGNQDLRRKRSKSDAPTKAKLTPLAQPVVFRMRSTPRPLPTPPSSILIAPSASSSSTSTSSDVSGSRPRSHSKSSSLGSIREPLTPLSSMFSNRLSMMPEEARERKEKELKRRKMEKVKRTLGENVPPELVFGSRPPPPASAPSSIPASHVKLPARKTVNGRKPRPRSLSVPVSHPPFLNVEIDTTPDPTELPPLHPSPEPRPHVQSAPSVPPRPLNAPTRPRSHSKSYSHSAVATLTISPAPSSHQYAPSGQVKKGYYAPNDVGTTIGYKGKTGKVLERTAFATLVAGQLQSSSVNELGLYPSAVQAVMGPVRASSLDIHPTHRVSSLDADRAERTRATLTPIQYVYGVKGKKEGDVDMEDWKRKEREWSGEWNVRDMGDVVRRLRGLKAA